MTKIKAVLNYKKNRRLQTNGKNSAIDGDIISGSASGFLDSRLKRVAERTPAPVVSRSITQSIENPIQGETVEFSISSSFSNEASIQWALDGVGISGATAISYSREMLSTDNGKTLSVTVTDGSNSYTVSRELVVITYTYFFDPAVNVFQETSGAIGGLTASGDGDPVGTWADTSGTFVLRAPGTSSRMTRVVSSSGSYLNRTADSQHYSSDDAAGTWAFLHDGTKYTFASAFASTQADSFFTLLDTCGTSGSNRGVWFSWDDRDSQSLNSAVKFLISAGSLNRSVNTTDTTGVALNRWHRLVSVIDPEASQAIDRIAVYNEGRPSTTNSFTGGVSASDPTFTLRVAGYNGAANSGPTGKLGPILIYTGEWTTSQVAAFCARFDFDADGYQEQIRSTTVAGTQYAKFPHLAVSNDGVMVVSYRIASSHNSTDGVLYTKTSVDDGASWLPQKQATTLNGRDVREGTLFYNAQGDLILIVTSRDDAPLTDYRLDIFASGDHGLTWSDTKATITAPAGFDYVFSNSSPALSADGSFWFLSCYGTNTSTGDGTGLLYQSVNGIDWTFVTAMNNNGLDLYEPTVINTGGSSWLCVYRGPASGVTAEAYVSTSVDGGQNWSNPVDQNVQGVQPKLFKFGDQYFCGVTDRAAATLRYCVSVYPYYEGVLQGGIHSHFLYEQDGALSDLGHNSAQVYNDFVYMVFYDQAPLDGVTDAGVTFRKYRYPKIGG